VYSKFIKVSRAGSGEDRAQKFYDALDDKGRAAVRYGMIANALDDAAITGSERIAPSRFARSLENIAEARGVFFKGQEKAELDGFVNLMRHAERFGQYTENPPTGQRLIPWLVGGAAALDPATTTMVGGAAYAARLLMTTQSGRALLLEASRIKAGAPEMSAIAQQVAQQIPRMAAETKERDSKGRRQ
jgi:hypothetical protein